MTDDRMEGSVDESRLGRLEAEMRGLRKFVTTLESGHEARAKQWNRKIAQLTSEVQELKDRIRKTKKKVKRLSR